ncbi:hypothetical protein SAMN05421736_11523 [Evansella caseinilytica]|uniref:Uncharacterized protein n=1 Tax=Evansella caseinilytica TaxID=1503961 RepID=A0A1H3TL32_9BACI|nr:hypothetical protein [Evansella caseinilytica]SDZ50521.1 hypothetical protein SAMN05421736_11523 [Evansella caseinilytica]
MVKTPQQAMKEAYTQVFSKAILVNADEITTITAHLLKIIFELEENATPNIEKLGRLKYYEAGKAEKAMEVYKEANEKMLDLYNNYCRASSLVFEILEVMMELDETIAEKIAAKLGG